MTDTLSRLQPALEGRYRVVRELGAGGMATVYLARDLRHDRDVAIKVLRPELGAVLGVERFLAEIRVTANLQHPNLLPLFDSGEADGLLYYVMPYVEGETLRARIEREKQLPVEEAVRLSVAIAQALEHAHRRGVIHRDLKPENVLLADGQPLVADFGIALAVSKAGGQRVTQTGLSLGTPQYMSPEQATGDRVVDARTDIYSLAAITYEMLTGEPPHIGNTAQAIIARLMTEDVRPLTAVRRSVPLHVDSAVRRALEKLAADRFATAGDYALALQGRGDTSAASHYSNAADGSNSRRGARWREVAAWTVALGALATLGFSRTKVPVVPETPVLRTKIDPPAGERIMLGGFPIAVSPAGDQIAYVTQSTTGYRTLVQRLGEIDAYTEVSPTSLRDLAFAPDGRSIAYSQGGGIRRMPAAGGANELLGTVKGSEIFGLAWLPDDRILVGSDLGLLVVSARGGTVQPIGADRRTCYFPLGLPAGDVALCRSGSRLDPHIIAVDLRTGRVTETGVRAVTALGLYEGHLLVETTSGGLQAVPFDAGKHTATGEPIVIERSADGAGASPNGTLAYRPGKTAFQLVLAGAGVADQPLRPEPAAFATPRFSPDGRRLVVTVLTEQGSDIWMLDRSSGTFSRLTTSGTNTAPEWTADGKRVLYKALPFVSGSPRAGDATLTRIMSQPVDGSAPASVLFESPFTVNEAILSTDGRWLVVRTPPGDSTPRDIFVVDLMGDRRMRPFVAGPASEIMPRLSPDGHWLAYQSDESGRSEIYVKPFPAGGARVQVSDAGGSEPLWDANGRTLYYRATAGITAVSLAAGAELSVTARRLILSTNEAADPTHPSYDVLPGGTQFALLRPAGGEAKAIIVHNWTRELRERLGRSGAR